MTPVLFDRYSTRSMIGVLDDCISCTVTEEVNGVFECTFQYPVTGKHFEQLINYGGMIYASHAHGLSGKYKADYFDVYKYSAPINGIVTFYAQHISYRLSNVIVRGGWTATDPNDLLQKIAANTVTPNEFSFLISAGPWDDGTITVNSFDNARRLMLGRDGAISAVNTWRCEFEFFDNRVQVIPKRGADNGVSIRYGKNLTNFQREKDNGGIVSQIFPYWHDSDNLQFVEGDIASSPNVATGYSPWTTTERGQFPPQPPFYYDEPVFSSFGELYFRPAIIMAAAMDFSDKFDTTPTANDLKRAALAYMRKDSTWRPNDNITIDFIDLFNTPEYADVQEMEKCNVGDFVNVYYPELGVVSTGVEIVSATYDTLADRYTQMQLGTIKTTLAQTIIDYIGGVYK